MKLRLTPRAVAESKRKKRWWQRHRAKAPGLFDQELSAAIGRIVATPGSGALHDEQTTLAIEVRHVLMRKTQNHIYYCVEGDEVVVLSVWGARKGQTPKL